jgi:hypothetical protein
MVPWLVLGDAAPAAWCVAMAACFVAGAWLLPVRRDVRGWILILGALDWPLLYAVKLGQVGPVLFLLFAIAWRAIDRPVSANAPTPSGGAPRDDGSATLAVGLAAGIGAIVKVQPALLGVWALATHRYRTVVAAVGIAGAIALATLPFTGLGAWFTYADLVRGLGGTFDTAHDFAPGAIAHMAGAGDLAAALVQTTCAIVTIGCLLLAWRYASPVIGFLVTIVGSQVLSAPLRDHYALLLLLPTAWLLERGRGWAAAIPLLAWISIFAFAAPANATTAQLATSFEGSSWLAASVIPLSFFGCLAVLLIEAFLERRRSQRVQTGLGAMLGR